jgi:Icc-related predicted phosphoesterase
MFSKLDPAWTMEIVQGITDFLYIDINRFNELFEQAKAFLEKEVDKDCIVVTHFVPTYLSMHPQYKGNYVNSFFITEMYNFIDVREPKMWIHGHTHSPFDYMINKTRVICNPLGYLGENPNFNSNLIVEV